MKYKQINKCLTLYSQKKKKILVANQIKRGFQFVTAWGQHLCQELKFKNKSL
jgi:hypothetical protein